MLFVISQELRRHIGKRAELALEPIAFLFVIDREAKISDLDSRTLLCHFVDKYVFRLQVAMANPLLMQVVDSHKELLHDVLDLRLGENLLVHDILKCAPRDVLSHDVLVRSILQQAEDSHSVRVVDPFE